MLWNPRSDAEVAERQTRRSQKPLGLTARVGSNPTFGTKNPDQRGCPAAIAAPIRLLAHLRWSSRVRRVRRRAASGEYHHRFRAALDRYGWSEG